LYLQGDFSTLCFVLRATDGKIEQHVSIKFCVNIGKSATKILEMLHEAFGEYGTHFSRLVESQLMMTNVQGGQAPEK
jgi:hypothetical protein